MVGRPVSGPDAASRNQYPLPPAVSPRTPALTRRQPDDRSHNLLCVVCRHAPGVLVCTLLGREIAMRVLRGMGGVLLWILASVVCLVALILCATILLLPLGIPLLMLGRRMFAQAFRLLLPRAAAHPVKTAKESS